LPKVLGDRIYLLQLVLNLVLHSIEAMSGVSDGPRELWSGSEKLAATPHQSGEVEAERRFTGDPAVAGQSVELCDVVPSGGTRSERQTPNADLSDIALATSERAYVLVSVADSGPGLDLNNLDRLFEAFYTTKPQGLGMGLSISRSIIEAHGGRLWAKANVPKGALFQFTLPVASD
ncbi:MAG: hypothetical protein JOZ61_07320, partial [Verrucomicrobia bacterium]|nr:hypothetical protein [Verrucomicrobiota bacterium]